MGGDRETQAVQNLTARGRRVENNPKVYPRIQKLILKLPLSKQVITHLLKMEALVGIDLGLVQVKKLWSSDLSQ